MYKEEVDLDEGTKQVLAHGGKGQYKAVRDGDITKVMYKGKVVGTADFDSGADSFFASIKGEKGQKSFDDAQAMVDYFAKNKITEEVDLDEAKIDPTVAPKSAKVIGNKEDGYRLRMFFPDGHDETLPEIGRPDMNGLKNLLLIKIF